jgi:hypothetical protein
MSAVLNYTPHPAQMEIHKARSKRFRTVCTGRRFGKTLCMAAELLDRGCGEAGGDSKRGALNKAERTLV